MNHAALTIDNIQRSFGYDTYQRGRTYADSGAVTSLSWIGDTLKARVQGNQFEPYIAQVAFLGNQIAHTECTCPIGSGCKHIVAMLIRYVAAPDAIEELPELAALLAPLNRDQIEAVLIGLADRDSQFYDEVVVQINLALTAASRLSGQAPDPSSFMAVARAAFRETPRRYYDSWGDDAMGSDIAEQVRPLIEELDALISTRQANDALPALEAVTGEFVSAWRQSDDEYETEGALEDVGGDLGPLWTHAMLASNLSLEQRLTWKKKLAAWGEQTQEYFFDNACEAVEHGWDHPIVLNMLAGDEMHAEVEEWEAEDVLIARVRVLREQGRTTEMLNVARATEQHVSACVALVELERWDEAIAYAIAKIASPPELLSVCKALWSAGAQNQALRLGEYGLPFGDPKTQYAHANVHLAQWVRDVAREAGKPDLVLRAAERAFEWEPSLSDYELIRDLSNDQWEDKKERLLQGLREAITYSDAPVSIFLLEQRWDDALAAGQNGHSYMLERVLEAAAPHRPLQVFQIASKKAESIMDSASAKYYENAVNWLRYARAAYELTGRLAEWQTYLQKLLATHQRKYKLVPMLRELD